MSLQKNLLMGVALALFAGTTGAAPIFVDPIGASDNGSYPGAPSSNTISGVNSSDATPELSDSGASVATGQPVPPSGGYPTVTTGGNAHSFYQNYAANVGSPVITYTLNQAYTITGGHFWQYSGDTTPGADGSGQRSLISADIYTSSTGLAGSYVLSGTLTPGYVEPAYGTADPGVDFSLTAPVSNVEFIQLQNIQGVPNQFITVGFSQIRFVAVPEPASLGLLSLGGLGLLARRRRA